MAIDNLLMLLLFNTDESCITAGIDAAIVDEECSSISLNDTKCQQDAQTHCECCKGGLDVFNAFGTESFSVALDMVSKLSIYGMKYITCVFDWKKTILFKRSNLSFCRIHYHNCCTRMRYTNKNITSNVNFKRSDGW